MKPERQALLASKSCHTRSAKKRVRSGTTPTSCAALFILLLSIKMNYNVQRVGFMSTYMHVNVRVCICIYKYIYDI